VFHKLKKLLADKGYATAVGDGVALRPTEEQRRGDRARARGNRGGLATGLGEDIAIALDPASSEFYKNGKYVLEARERRTASRHDRLLGEWGVALPDRLDRGRPRRVGLERWKALTRGSAHARSSSATTCS